MLTLRSLILLLCQTPIVQLYPEAAAQIWLVPLKIIFIGSKFKPVLNLNLFLADFIRGSGSLNSELVTVLVF